MRGCQSNTFLAVNCEVNFFCIVLDGFTWGNVFNSIVETNCDARGAIFVPQVLKQDMYVDCNLIGEVKIQVLFDQLLL